jgi:hypothetical protein
MQDFETKISRLDTSLFRHIQSQTTENEKKSLLALQAASRELQPFVYLEIGSFLGGSLQPYIVDPKCQKIISIDPRPQASQDARGDKFRYPASTQAMVEGLRNIPGANLEKLHCIESGTPALSPEKLPAQPSVCFIDGEHTDMAVLMDARFCLSALGERGMIVFHDANIVYAGIAGFIRELDNSGRPFRAFNLLDSVFFIEVGETKISEREPVRSLLQQRYQGYLWSLAQTDGYRSFYRHPFFRLYRDIKTKTWSRLIGRLHRLKNSNRIASES